VNQLVAYRLLQMAFRVVTLGLLWVSAQAGFSYPFCTDGISKADLAENEAVEVIFAQAPLFSTNPSIGQKGKYLNLYHTCIVLAQGAGSSRRYWTLEFDFTGGDVLKSIIPQFHLNLSAPGGVSMVWHNDARYCLTEGIKWGEQHWTKNFQILFDVTAAQVQQTFTDLVSVVNTTAVDTKPEYQLWRVAKKSPDSSMLVQDMTCADGALWFLHHLKTVHKAIFPPTFEFRGTATILNADHVKKVDMSDWKAVDKMALYFKIMADLVGANKSMAHRLIDVLLLVHESKKYVYDSNMQVYYELSGNNLPWIWFEYAQYGLLGPPWLQPNSTKPNTTSTVVV